MARHWKDALDDEWDVELHQEAAEHPDTGELLPHGLLYFSADERSMAIFVRGEVPERVRDMVDAQLELAMEAAKDGRGFLFVDLGGHFWWVKRGGEDDLDEQGCPVTFDDGVDELRHPGPLPAPADEQSDDEIEELLDQARGVTA